MSQNRRVVLKLSGESMAGGKESGIDMNFVGKLADAIKAAKTEDIQISIVVGGGNFWRGRDADTIER